MTSATCRRRWTISPLRRQLRLRQHHDRRSRPRRIVARGGAVAAPVAAWRHLFAGGHERKRGQPDRHCPRCPDPAVVRAADRFIPADRPVGRSRRRNSHSAKPWIYKFAGAWGNHEGSMCCGSVCRRRRAGIALFGRRLSRRCWPPRRHAGSDRPRLLCFPVVRLEPFARSTRRRGGQGLNPLLQDPVSPSIRRRSTRLCRAVGGVQPRGRGALNPRSRPALAGRCGRGCWLRGYS